MEGIVLKTDAGYVARFEHRSKHPVEKVWAGVTQPSVLSRWLADATIEMVEGGRIQLRFGNTGSVMNGRVTKVSPPTLFEYTWDSEDAESTLVRWELHPEADGCRLVLTHTFPTPDKLPIMMAGWHTHLEGFNLAVDGSNHAWPWGRWEELRSRYTKTLAQSGGLPNEG